MQAQTLDIFKFIDYRAFLREFYKLNKESKEGLSYASWATQAKFKSRSFIRLVLAGKRNLTPESCPKLVQTLSLNNKEEKYFLALVNFNQATDISQREEYWSEVLKRRSSKSKNQITDTYQFLSSHWCPRIQVITSLKNIDRSTEALSKVTGLCLSKIQEYLEILSSLNLITNEQGQWQATESHFTVDTSLNDLAIQSFHKKSLEMAINSIPKKSNKRFFTSLMMPMDERTYQQAINEITDFAKLFRSKYGAACGKNKKLYQINFSNIPVSSQLIHTNESELDQNVTNLSKKN